VVAIIAAVSTLRGGERRRLIVGLGTLLLVVAPWWIRNIVREANPIFPQSLPLLGGGVNVGNLGHFDTEYVPNRAAWPLYSLFEPIDDRSGFGPLFVLALVPGLAALSTRGRRRPAVLLAAAFVLSLPFWWKYTLHEPRFLLAYVGLAAALVPWAIAAAGRWARVVGALVAAAAVLALVLVFDQAIIPSARLPVERARFYDRVYGVDPAVASLPERVPLLQVTGYGLGRVEYAALYPLLGPSQRRRVLQLDSGLIRGSTRLVVARMRRAGIRYAYVTALARNRAAVERLFAPSSFTLIHRSGLAQRGRLGARRHVFGPVAPASPSAIVTRYLFAVHVRQPA
jgi:hypothetical protein